MEQMEVAQLGRALTRARVEEHEEIRLALEARMAPEADVASEADVAVEAGMAADAAVVAWEVTA